MRHCCSRAPRLGSESGRPCTYSPGPTSSSCQTARTAAASPSPSQRGGCGGAAIWKFLGWGGERQRGREGGGTVLKIDSPTLRPTVRPSGLPPSAAAGSPMGIAGRGRAGGEAKEKWDGGARGRGGRCIFGGPKRDPCGRILITRRSR